jgi:hypothetical protein
VIKELKVVREHKVIRGQGNQGILRELGLKLVTLRDERV